MSLLTRHFRTPKNASTRPRRLARAVSILTAAALAVGSLLVATPAAAANNAVLVISKSPDRAVVDSGGVVLWEIQLGCESLETWCWDAEFTDTIPAPFTLSGAEAITIVGYEKEPTVTVVGNSLKVGFNETSTRYPGQKGLWDGQKITIHVSTDLPADTPADQLGTEVVNTADATASNAAPKSATASVTTRFVERPAVTTTKSWSAKSVIAGSSDTVTATVSVRNSSNIAATSLSILDPAPDTATPFNLVKLVGLGAVTMPEGADRVSVTVTNAAGDVFTSPASTTASLPSGIAPEDISTIAVAFTSSAGGSTIPVGAVGSIELVVAQRDSVPTGASSTVSNTARGSVETSAGSAVLNASASFTIEPRTVAVVPGKSFTPSRLLTGASSTVTLTADNASNIALRSLVVTEPAPGTNSLTANGLTFSGFAATGSAWPAGATAATITVMRGATADAAVTIESGDAWPTVANPATVTGFVVEYTGTIAPGASASIPFGVTTSATTPTTIENKVAVDGVSTSGLVAEQKVAPATLRTDVPAVDASVTKSLTPAVIGGAVGQQLVASLTGKVVDSNVPVTEFVLSDLDDVTDGIGVWDRFALRQLVGVTVPSGAVLTVTDGAGVPVAGGQFTGPQTVDFTLPSEVNGIRLVFTSESGFANNTTLKARLLFEATTVSAPEEVLRNCANALSASALAVDPEAARHCATVTVGTGGRNGTTPILALATAKSWTPSTLWIPEAATAAYPHSALTFSVTSTGPIPSQKLTITEPSGTTDPFDIVDIVAVTSITLPAGADAATTQVRILGADGSDLVNVTGATAISQARALDAAALADATGIIVSVSGRLDTSAQLTVVLDTVLRTHTRDGAVAITPALAHLGGIVANQVYGTVADGPYFLDSRSTADLTVLPERQQPLAATLGKTISPNTGTILSPDPDRTVLVDLTATVTDPQSRPTSLMIEDGDARFFNAFDFAGIRDVQAVAWQSSTDPNYFARVDYLSGATMSVVNGEVVATGGSWSAGTPFALPNGRGEVLESALPAIANADVQGVRVTYTAKSPSVLPINAPSPSLRFDVVPREVLRSGGPVTANDVVTPMPSEAAPGQSTNRITGTITNAVKDVPLAPVEASYTFLPGELGYNISKDPRSITLFPGKRQDYRLTVENSGTRVIENPVFSDVVPLGNDGRPLLVYNRGELGDPRLAVTPTTASITTDISKVTVTVDPTTGAVSIAFPEGSRLLPGERYTVTLPLAVAAGVAPTGTELIVNTFRFTGSGGVDKSVSAEIAVTAGAAYWRTKDVREIPDEGDDLTGIIDTRTGLDGADTCFNDGGYFRTPCLVQTQPRGFEEWRVRLTNSGNLPTTSLSIVDVLPYAGDTGTSLRLSPLPRGSQWGPTFRGDIQWIAEPPAGAQVQWYHQTAADERCEFTGNPSSSTPRGDGCAEWHEGIPTDASTVTAIRLDVTMAADRLLQPGEEIGFTYLTRSAATVPDGGSAVNSPAWNSIVGTTATLRPDSTIEYETLEPNKAGVAISLPTYSVAVGDYVWADANRNGVQDAGELPVAGVEVILYDIDDVEVGRTTTDAEGRYLFDSLDPGRYWIQFELTDRQRELGFLTEQDAGTDTLIDSNADPITGRTAVFELGEPSAKLPNMVPASSYEFGSVVADYIDPSIDAGIIPRSVTVGDLVWVDSNRNGLQDDGEPGIQGVVLTLVGPDGKAVTNVFGKTVGPIATGADGRYVFANLPVIGADQHYTVRIDREASATALSRYLPTRAGVGDDRGLDSSDWEAATTRVLSADGSEDLTLDFGFVLKPTQMASTGLPVSPLLALALLAIGAGVLVIIVRRRTPQVS